jgi:branched-chain amino acid transport system substrate-binding protein
MLSRYIAIGMALAAGALASTGAVAQDTVKIGLVMPLTGGLGPVGKQVTSAAKLYVQQHGATVAGKKIELIIKDDAGVPDNSKRLAQELVVNDKVAFIGAGITPSSLAIAPIATQGKTATVIMVSGTSIVTERSPYFVRTSFTLGQQSSIIATWAAKNGSKKVVIVQSDWAPGAEASAVFTEYFTKAGGQVAETIKVPLANPDFAPFLQRARDANPDTLFVFVPASQAGTFTKQFLERGFDKAGVKLIGPGDITDDDDLPGMSDAMIGTVTSGFYSAYHQSAMNKKYVADFKAAYNFRPNFISLGG